MFYNSNPPMSKASKEVANLTERKIHIPLYMVSKNLSVCLSVCLSVLKLLRPDFDIVFSVVQTISFGHRPNHKSLNISFNILFITFIKS